jgi:hypothetical protein
MKEKNDLMELLRIQDEIRRLWAKTEDKNLAVELYKINKKFDKLINELQKK